MWRSKKVDLGVKRAARVVVENPSAGEVLARHFEPLDGSPALIDSEDDLGVTAACDECVQSIDQVLHSARPGPSDHHGQFLKNIARQRVPENLNEGLVINEGLEDEACAHR